MHPDDPCRVLWKATVFWTLPRVDSAYDFNRRSPPAPVDHVEVMHAGTGAVVVLFHWYAELGLHQLARPFLLVTKRRHASVVHGGEAPERVGTIGEYW
jgi:hypothetical protein